MDPSHFIVQFEFSSWSIAILPWGTHPGNLQIIIIIISYIFSGVHSWYFTIQANQRWFQKKRVITLPHTSLNFEYVFLCITTWDSLRLWGQHSESPGSVRSTIHAVLKMNYNTDPHMQSGTVAYMHRKGLFMQWICWHQQRQAHACTRLAKSPEEHVLEKYNCISQSKIISKEKLNILIPHSKLILSMSLIRPYSELTLSSSSVPCSYKI